MKRKSTVFFCAGGLLLALATGAWADEMPTRKAGLWEMQMSGDASTATRMCTSAEVEKKMQEMALAGGMDSCSKLDIRKTASGYVIDAVCQSGPTMSVTSHSEFTGDFNSAYTMKQAGHVEMKGAKPMNTNMTIQAKWVGDCPPDWKPGDVEMPGGRKVNMARGSDAGGKPKKGK